MGANNDANAASSDDAKNPAKPCPLKKSTVQLLPLRYGLVEDLSVEETIGTPYETKAKPLGLRLIRDGWLYFLFQQEEKWIIYEYFVEDGKVEKLLWQGADVTSDTRINSLGEKAIIVPKTNEMFIAYSEVQWTAKKCSQVISNKKDREQFLKKIDTKNINAQKGNDNLLVPNYAKNLIAEVAEKKIEKKEDYEFDSYEWEDVKTYKHTGFGNINSQIANKYENDALYVVFQDDIGVLRDLAQYQDIVVEALNEWQEDEKNYQKYQEGLYIKSQVELSPSDINSLISSPEQQNLVKELNKQQKLDLADWIEFRSMPEKYPHERALNYQEKESVLVKSLGKNLYEKYEDAIEDMIDDYDESINGVSWYNIFSGDAGKDGILDVIHYDDMNTFLEQQTQKLDYWRGILASIAEDRAKLFTKFYYSAWYFDSNNSSQVEALLSSEYSCIRDICINDEATKIVANTLDKMPWISYRGIYSLEYKNRLDLIEQLLKNLKLFKDIKDSRSKIHDATNFAHSTNALVSQEGIGQRLIDINENTAHYNSLISQSLFNVVSRDISANLDSALNNNSNIDLLTRTNSYVLLEMFKAYRNENLKIEFSNHNDLSKFKDKLSEYLYKKKTNISLKNRIRERGVLNRKRGTNRHADPVLKQLKDKRKQNKIDLEQLEVDIKSKTSIIPSGGESYGIVLGGLTSDELEKIRAYQSDVHYARNSLGELDYLSVALLIISAYKTIELFGKYSQGDTKTSSVDLLAAFTSTLSSTIALVVDIKGGIYKKLMKQASTSEAKLLFNAKYGKVMSYGGHALFLFGFIASSFMSVRSFRKLVDGFEKNDKEKLIKGLLSFTTDFTMTAINSYGLANAVRASTAIRNAVAIEKAAVASIQGARMMSVFTRFNLIGLAVTVVQQAGTVWYNKVFISDNLKWIKQSVWGTDNKNFSLEHSQYELACITSVPFIQIEKNKGQDKKIHIVFPTIGKEDFHDSNVKIGFYTKSQRWIDNTLMFLEESEVTLSNSGTIVSYQLADKDITSYSIKIEYEPVPDKKSKGVYFQWNNAWDETVIKETDKSDLDFQVKSLPLRNMDKSDLVITNEK